MYKFIVYKYRSYTKVELIVFVFPYTSVKTIKKVFSPLSILLQCTLFVDFYGKYCNHLILF